MGRRKREGAEKEQHAFIKVIKGSTELCLEVFIQLISKMANDCLTFMTINCTVFAHLSLSSLNSSSSAVTSILKGTHSAFHPFPYSNSVTSCVGTLSKLQNFEVHVYRNASSETKLN